MGDLLRTSSCLINGGANDVFFQLAAAQAVGTPAALLAAVEAITRSAIALAKIVATVVDHGARTSW
jgi:hypothetical protein